ncbi:hypothetical protein FX985_03269 [Pseudomonas extremaustralis]|uniref:Lipoprotein n=1 Tax=Pseudomonas extremaustralis TaxID=359110 RepID=A0A5M9J2Y5_9PSED|nr:hypothetical protein FX985_03269 [Pseudomonas extremaustralis]
MRRTIALATMALCMFSHAVAEERYIDANAGLVQINDGTYKNVVLLLGTEPVGAYCGNGWSYGFIQGLVKRGPSKSDMPGCWGPSNTPGQKFEFRFSSPTSAGIKSFEINGNDLRRLRYDTAEDDLIPSS